MRTYTLTNERLLINNSGTTLYRIMATSDFDDVVAGDLGGWVESRKNLSGDAWIYDNAKVYEYGLASGSVKLYNNSEVGGSAVVFGNGKLLDNVKLLGKTKVGGTATIFNSLLIDAKIEINEDSWSGVTYYLGSRDIVWQESKNTLTIGCVKKYLSEWVNNFQTIGMENNYTQADIDEYAIYIQQIANLYI